MRRAYCVIFLILAFLLSAPAFSQFHSVKYAAEFATETPVNLTQGDNAQVWLFTDNSLSLFTGEEFVPYQSFNFSTPIVGGLVINDGFLIATEAELVFSNKENASRQPISLWQATNESISNILKSESTVFFSTDKAIYAVSMFPQTYEIQKVHSLSSPLLDIELSTDSLYVLQAEKIVQLPLDGSEIIESPLTQSISQLGTQEASLYGLQPDGEVLRLFVNKQQVNTASTGETAVKLVTANHSLNLISGQNIFNIANSDERHALPVVPEKVFIDSANNLWLATPYDVQVQWRQEIGLRPSQTTQLDSFDLKVGNFAMRNELLYQWVHDTNSWQLKANLSNVANSEKMLATRDSLWFVKQNSLIAVNKGSYVVTVQTPIAQQDLVLMSGNNKVVVVSQNSITEIQSNGLERQVRTCEISCLPSYKINQHLWDGRRLWLATSQGLHELDVRDWQFSQQRIDAFNALSPLLAITEQSDMSQLWLLYPNKIALFDPLSLTSRLYFSDNNRLFSIQAVYGQTPKVTSQKGTFELVLPNEFSEFSQKVSLHKFSPELARVSYWTPDSIMQLTANEQELRLGFNLMKQHTDQSVFFRFKYEDDLAWSESVALRNSLTLKELRQGSNKLVVQARLEGQAWSQSRVFSYDMPYKYLQTKWVLIYTGIGLLIAGLVYIYERYKRIRVVFNALKQESFITSLLESTKDGVWVANKDREIQSVNHAFFDISGFEADEVVGSSFQLHSGKGRNHELESLIWQEVIKTGFWSGEVWTKKKSGEDISMDLSVTRVETQEPLGPKKDIRYVGVFSDVTARKSNEKAMRKLATRDPLTDLSNRTLFIELIEQSIATANPMNPNFAVVFLDLDNFSKVNANLGPLQGDELIKSVAKRLCKDLDKGVSIARLAADEFAFLIPNYLFTGEPAFYIRRLANDIKRKLQPSFMLANTEVTISASLGVAYYPIHGVTAESIMRCADTALKKVKDSGKNNFLIYEKALDNDESELLTLESELIRALDNDEFKVYFQPKYLLEQHQISGYEALVRWQSPTRGIVPPDQFIGLAEQNGLIRQVDSTVMEKVCEQIQQWQKQGVEFGKVAVNVSPLNFQQMEFCQTIKNIVNNHKVQPSAIELEITESAMMSDPDQTLANLQELRSLGFSIALDDFGTGHSSLGHLKYFPIDRLKIDRTFVKDIETSDQDKNLVSVTIQLAKHLGIKVIAEGVENQNQAYILHVLGCNEVQGYMISKPLPADEVLPFIQERLEKLPDIALD
jgi:diguanylate cyclase (GGDEF)-like protein/PAS domain S-box-containing protein